MNAEREPPVRRLTAFLKSGKGQKCIVAAGLLGMALILLSEFWPEKNQTSEVPKASPAVSAEEYAAKVEEKLSSIITNVEGVGGCRVMVTLENGVEYVYASEQKTGSDRVEDNSKLSQKDDSEQSVIIVDTENGREGLLVTEIQPTIKGVMVVCQGGGSEEVRQRVTEAVTTVLNITSKRVCVVPGT